MKKIFLSLCMISAFLTNAQIVSPQPSPSVTVVQAVGLSEVTLKYSRPAMRGRTIVGDLVPYNAIWRTGANANTTITVNTSFEFAGNKLAAGTYAIYTKPTENNWEVYLYSKNDNWGAPAKWDPSLVVATATVMPQKTERTMSSFSIALNELNTNGALLEIHWENTLLAIPLDVPTDEIVMSAIKKTLKASPKANDYYAAAVYFLSANKDIDQALEWMDTAMSQIEKPAFWQLRQQSLLYERAGRIKEAIATAEASLAAALEANNMDYVKMNKESLAKWQQ